MGSGAGSRVCRSVLGVRPSRRTDCFEKAAAQRERPRGRSRADESREASLSRPRLEPDGRPASLVLDQLVAPALPVRYELRQSQRAPVARRERRHVAADLSEHSMLHERVQFGAFVKLHAPTAAISVPRRVRPTPGAAPCGDCEPGGCEAAFGSLGRARGARRRGAASAGSARRHRAAAARAIRPP